MKSSMKLILAGIAALALMTGAAQAAKVAPLVRVQQASEAPLATNEADALKQIKAAEKVVKKALKTGDPIVANRVSVIAEKSPAIAGALLALGPKDETQAGPVSELEKPEEAMGKREPLTPLEGPFEEPETVAASRAIRTNTSACYGSVYHKAERYTVAGIVLAWVYIAVPGWCGISHVRILGYPHPQFATYTAGPYCMKDVNHYWGWDGSPRWMHGAISAETGVPYPWGCLGIAGLKAPIRISASGYWDAVNDLGF